MFQSKSMRAILAGGLTAALLAAASTGYLVEYMPRSVPILNSELRLEDGYLVAPDAPGLGVELNETACEKYRVQ